jgi:uncharacterized protein
MKSKVHFSNSKGDKLVGILAEPEDSKNKPLVIIVHGFTSHKNSKVLIDLSNELTKDNIATLRIDLYAHGESEGDFKNITVSEAIDDILHAIEYGKSLGYAKIGLIGSSFGGISSIMAATKFSDLTFLGLKSPVSDFEEVWQMRMTHNEMDTWKDKGWTMYDGKKLNYTIYEDLKNNHPYESASVITIPTLVVHGDKDSVVPIKQSEKLVKIIPHAELHIVQGADHWYTGEGEKEEFINTMNRFVLKHV